MDPRITTTYVLQGLAGIAGGVSVYLLVMNTMKGDPMGVTIDVFCLIVQYWIFCYQNKLRNYIKEQNKWRNKR